MWKYKTAYEIGNDVEIVIESTDKEQENKTYVFGKDKNTDEQAFIENVQFETQIQIDTLNIVKPKKEEKNKYKPKKKP